VHSINPSRESIFRREKIEVETHTSTGFPGVGLALQSISPVSDGFENIACISTISGMLSESDDFCIASQQGKRKIGTPEKIADKSRTRIPNQAEILCRRTGFPYHSQPWIQHTNETLDCRNYMYSTFEEGKA
jgi:hypothetical protein